MTERRALWVSGVGVVLMLSVVAINAVHVRVVLHTETDRQLAQLQTELDRREAVIQGLTRARDEALAMINTKPVAVTERIAYTRKPTQRLPQQDVTWVTPDGQKTLFMHISVPDLLDFLREQQHAAQTNIRE